MLATSLGKYERANVEMEDTAASKRHTALNSRFLSGNVISCRALTLATHAWTEKSSLSGALRIIFVYTQMM